MSTTSLQLAVEEAVQNALSPMLSVNGGYLLNLDRFRGKLSEFNRFIARSGPGPYGFIGILDPLKIQDNDMPNPDISMTVTIMLMDSSMRGESARVEGSNDAPGCYQMGEDAIVLIKNTVFTGKIGRASCRERV